MLPVKTFSAQCFAPMPTGTLFGEGEEEDGGRLADGELHDDSISRQRSINPSVGRRHSHAARGPDRQDPDDARLAVHQTVRERDTRVGRAHDSDPGDDRRVAEGAGSVAVP